MPRFRRVVVPGFPHHVTDRGNRPSNVFLDDSDRLVFLHSLHESAEHYLLSIFSYSLMTNHFHLVCTPEEDCSLAKAMHDVLGVLRKLHQCQIPLQRAPLARAISLLRYG
jgi:putative transposase